MDAAGRVTAKTDEARPEPAATPVSWLRAASRGFLCRCPACGEGRLFSGFLTVRDRCEACGLDLHHHRADDFPPYIVIFVVGHVIGTGLLITETRYDVPLPLQLVLWPMLAIAMSLALLRPAKGVVVGLQYAFGMHGFGETTPEPARPES